MPCTSRQCNAEVNKFTQLGMHPGLRHYSYSVACRESSRSQWQTPHMHGPMHKKGGNMQQAHYVLHTACTCESSKLRMGDPERPYKSFVAAPPAKPSRCRVSRSASQCACMA